MKYRKRPVAVEAEQYVAGKPAPKGVLFTGEGTHGWLAPGLPYVITIHEQNAYLDDGDWVITEHANPDRHYPCKDFEFQRIYEPAAEHSPGDYEATYGTFWKSVVEEPDGTLNLDLVKRELHDFHCLMQSASKVYTHITGGKISNVLTDPDVVIAIADDEEVA